MSPPACGRASAWAGGSTSLTRRPVDGQVAEVTALDQLHGQAAGGGTVSQADQQLGDAAVGQGLGGRGTVALGGGREAELGIGTLREGKQMGKQTNSR